MEKSVILLSTTEFFFKSRLELNNVSNNVLEKDDVIDLTQSIPLEIAGVAFWPLPEC